MPNVEETTKRFRRAAERMTELSEADAEMLARALTRLYRALGALSAFFGDFESAYGDGAFPAWFGRLDYLLSRAAWSWRHAEASLGGRAESTEELKPDEAFAGALREFFTRKGFTLDAYALTFHPYGEREGGEAKIATDLGWIRAGAGRARDALNKLLDDGICDSPAEETNKLIAQDIVGVYSGALWHRLNALERVCRAHTGKFS